MVQNCLVKYKFMSVENCVLLRYAQQYNRITRLPYKENIKLHHCTCIHVHVFKVTHCGHKIQVAIGLSVNWTVHSFIPFAFVWVNNLSIQIAYEVVTEYEYLPEFDVVLHLWSERSQQICCNAILDIGYLEMESFHDSIYHVDYIQKFLTLYSELLKAAIINVNLVSNINGKAM